ncbi:MAG: nitrate reductase gamma subunit [Candidatus Zixiibacteriota bacterium]|nr:MAG: nitrate reductase gamma subunit [candidate division Zixibacteria bacterium]
MVWVQLISYLSIVVAAAAVIAKILKYATAPEHFRWELYPVPHEKGRSEYGGSYLEELDWWSKPRHSDIFNELKEMMLEIFFLKGVFHNNKRVWTSSFPFHFGLYLCIGWLVLLLLGGILNLSGVAVSGTTGVIGVIIFYLTSVFGYAGLILAGLGAFGLLIWRLADRNQRPYNSPAEYFNLILIDLVVIVALIAQLLDDPGFSIMRGYTASLITFSQIPASGFWIAAEIILISFLTMYIPLTRMSHFVAKYFLYHAVRWNDEPNMRGSMIEKKLLLSLRKKVGWSAPHIQTGKSWGEVVQETENE